MLRRVLARFSTLAFAVSSLAFGQQFTVEAENYDQMHGVTQGEDRSASNGMVIGYIDQNDWIKYHLDIPQEGSYLVEYRVSSPNGGQFTVIQDDSTLPH